MKWFTKQQTFLQEDKRRGQALTEYVLVLAFVSIFLVMGRDIVRDTVRELFFVAAASAELDVETSGDFKVICVTGERPKANIPSHPDNISYVDFFIDGTLFSTDATYKYCMNGENGQQCGKYDLPSGATVTMVAYDNAGNTGQCTRTMP